MLVLLSHVFSKNAILHKGCTKDAQNTKPLKIKHLRNFFGVFGVFGVAPKSDPLTPTPTPTDPLSDPVYFYIYLQYPKNHNKNHKIIENQGFGFLG